MAGGKKDRSRKRKASAPRKVVAPAGAAGRLRALFPILGLLCLLLLFYSAMVFEGEEPLSADTAASSAYAQWADESLQREGRVPLWYPDILLGMPSYASFIYTPASPISWIHRTFNLNRGTRYVLWFLVGGACLFGLLRRWGVSRCAAFLGALTFVFTPYVLGSMDAGHSSKLMALAFAPMVFLAVDYLLERGSILSVGLAAWAIALQLWANHPQIVFYTCLILAPYGVIWIWKDGRGRRLSRVLLIGLTLVLVGLMITLPYLPVAHYTPLSTRGAPSVLPGQAGSGTGDWDYATMWSFHPVELVSFLFPSFFGLAGDTYWGKMPFTQSTHASGLVPLLFAVLGCVVLGGWRRVFFIAASVWILVIGFGRHVPLLFGPLYHLVPFFDRFRVPSMIYAMLPLLVAILAAFALDRVAGGGSAAGRGPDEGFFGIAGIGLGVLALVGLLGLAGLGGGLATSGWFQTAREQAAGGPGSEMLQARREMLFGDLARSAGLAAVAAGLAWLRLRRRVPAGAFWGVVGMLIAIDLYTIDRAFYHPTPKPRIARSMAVDPEITREILSAGRPVRVLPLELGYERGGIALRMQQGNAYGLDGIQSTGGYHPAGLRRVKDFVLSNAWRNPAVWSAVDVSFVTAPVDPGYATVAGDLSRAAEAPQIPGLTEVTRRPAGRGEIRLYRNERTLGRAYVVPRARVVADPVARFAAMASPEFSPDREVLVEEAIPGDGPALSGWNAEATLVEYAADRVEVEVTGDGGYLVLADAVYPDWRAEIDGNPADIYPANHVLRCVPVPEGRHRVTFEFRDPAHGVARWLSGSGRVISLCLIALGLVLRRRKGGADAK